MRARCVYCDHISPGYLYCEIKQKCMTEHQARAPRSCGMFFFNPMNAITFEDYEMPKPKIEPCKTLSMFEEDEDENHGGDGGDVHGGDGDHDPDGLRPRGKRGRRDTRG